MLYIQMFVQKWQHVMHNVLQVANQSKMACVDEMNLCMWQVFLEGLRTGRDEARDQILISSGRLQHIIVTLLFGKASYNWSFSPHTASSGT